MPTLHSLICRRSRRKSDAALRRDAPAGCSYAARPFAGVMKKTCDSNHVATSIQNQDRKNIVTSVRRFLVPLQ